MVDLVGRMRADLASAMRAKEPVRIRVLRSTLAAVANAEAQPEPAAGPVSSNVAGGIAGASAGLASTEVPRKLLDEAAVRTIVAAERTERLDVAADLEARGASERAAVLRAEAAVLDAYL